MGPGADVATRALLAEETEELGRRTARRPGTSATRVSISYRFGMTTQIAVRLLDELVEYVDRLVGEGAGSRAAVVVQDARILEESGDYDDFDDLSRCAMWMSRISSRSPRGRPAGCDASGDHGADHDDREGPQ